MGGKKKCNSESNRQNENKKEKKRENTPAERI